MFLRAFQKAVVLASKDYTLKWALFFRSEMTNFHHVKYTSSAHQYSQKVVPDSITTDLIALQKLWKIQQSDKIDKFLFECFGKQKDCFSYILHIMTQARDHNARSSITLSYAIMRAFWLWLESNSISQPLTTQLQTEALIEATSTKDRHLIKLVCDAFRINNQCDFVYDVIDSYIVRKKFEEAGLCVTILKLQDKFPMEKILVPLTFRGNMNIVRLYVGDNSDMQLKLVKLLDNALQTPSSSRKLPLKQGKMLFKRLSSLLTSYKIPPEVCPNLCEIRTKCAIKLLMHKKYTEQSISDASWEEMIMVLLHDFPSLKKKVMYNLVEVKDFAAALKMANKLEIPFDEWPSVLKYFEGKTDEVPNFSFHAEVSESMKMSNGDLSLELDKSCLKYVETVEQFTECLVNISENYNIVGVDSEWRPHTGVSHQDNKLALMQLAVEDSVYLLDFLVLSDCLQETHWDNLTEALFGNPKILKLGCGLISDVEILVKNHQGTVGLPIRFSRLLDVAYLFRRFQYKFPDIVPEHQRSSFDSGNLLGLNKICSYVLGSSLNKEQQFSDWEVRPLRESQLSYAALDAYCLLQIYNKLEQIAEQKQLNFHDLVEASVRVSCDLPKESSDMRRKMKWSKHKDGFEIKPLISIKEFKVLMDHSLEDLARELKIFGADVSFFSESMSYHEATEIAKMENRIILASSSLYEQFTLAGAEKICYNISKDFGDDMPTAAAIFQKFNVKVMAGAISCSDPNES